MMKVDRPRFWLLPNPYHLEITVTLNPDHSVRADIFALPHCTGAGETSDEALLNLAKAMLTILEPKEHRDGSGEDRQ